MGWALLLVAASWGQAPPGDVVRSEGIDAGSGIAYVLISIDGRRVDGAKPTVPPRLTAQCTKAVDGKTRFELLADMGEVPEVRFVPPWVKKDSTSFPPVLAKTMVTMDFLGYTKVKPVKREWRSVDGLPGEMKYAAPGMHSGNMEEVMVYMQYLRALPTLRLTLPGETKANPAAIAEFETSRWQAKVKAEPLCWASGL